MLENKHILIGISAGIAAYKICELIRMFKRQGAEVKVVATPNALNFVTKLTLQNLSQNEVYIEEFNPKEWKPEHISLSDWADVYVIAPATANTIGKIAQGIADNFLTSVACAFSKQIILAPAMNSNMYNNEAVSKNLELLQSRGVLILHPETGFLACGYSGKGRLCSLEDIFSAVVEVFHYKNLFNGKKVIITSGGTIEEIDPVRYISNYSSGKMGHALADCAKLMGADVTLITTKDFDGPYEVVKVKSAIQMQQALNERFENSDIIIMAAAVADYRVNQIANEKIKKSGNETLTLELVKNPDILKDLCERKNHQIIVGFCAESQNLIENAKEKIAQKGCDYLVANDISRSDIGFSSDENEVIVFDKNGNSTKFEKAPKRIIARKILEHISL